jgi:hypothetical protein
VNNGLEKSQNKAVDLAGSIVTSANIVGARSLGKYCSDPYKIKGLKNKL